jgi:DNA-binding CsgD family transcriptional regulator
MTTKGKFNATGHREDPLDRADALACLEIIQESLGCQAYPELSAMVAKVGDLLGAEFCACLLSAGEPRRPANRVRIVEGTFPVEWLALYGQRQFHLIDPIVAENFREFSCQSWADTYRKSPAPKDFQSLAEDFGLRRGLSYGVREAPGGGGSLFSFSGPKVEIHPRTTRILELVLPHLHRMLCDLEARRTSALPSDSLSAREREVLKWIGAGKRSWETGIILHVTERTVNFHIANIMRKLNAVNRSQAVAVALKLGLVQLE